MTTSPDQAKEQVARLRDLIRRHDHLYYVLDSPEISDGEYDGLLRELRRLEELHPALITPDSPTQRVSGEPSERFQTVRHPVPLLSLGNVFDDEELEAWERRAMNLIPGETIDYYCELKYDGLAVALTYENGLLVRGATRGTGVEGEDVTANLRTVRSIPLSVSGSNVPPRFEVRGEIVFPIDKFEVLNREREERGERIYANPRNTAAGSVRQLDPQITASALRWNCMSIRSDGRRAATSLRHNLKLLNGLEKWASRSTPTIEKPQNSPRPFSSIRTLLRNANPSTTALTASSSRSTLSAYSAFLASLVVNQDGPSPTNTQPNKLRLGYPASKSTSDARGRSIPTPSLSLCKSAG